MTDSERERQDGETPELPEEVPAEIPGEGAEVAPAEAGQAGEA